MSATVDGVLGQMLLSRRPIRLRYVPVRPHPAQGAFLMCDDREVFYGGAAGPGKSTALLMAALQYADVPGYKALLLRRTYDELAGADGLIDKAHEWLSSTDARWNESKKRWTFPSGAILEFGHMQYDKDMRRYQSRAYQFVGFDELTSFTKLQYEFLALTRVRRPKVARYAAPDGLSLDRVPLRVRSASNPGNIGHEWVYEYFIDEDTRKPGVVFIPAHLHENPSLDVDTYRADLSQMSGVERERMLEGDWTVMESGGIFDLSKLVEVAQAPRAVKVIRRWDLAGTSETGQNDPDWTVGVRMERSADNLFTVTDVVAFRESPGETQRIFTATAKRDGKSVDIWLPQDPGQAGKDQKHNYAKLVPGFTIRGRTETGDKVTRARASAAAIDNQVLRFIKGLPHEGLVKSQLRQFPRQGVHDDAVDAIAGAFTALTQSGGGKGGGAPRGTITTYGGGTR